MEALAQALSRAWPEDQRRRRTTGELGISVFFLFCVMAYLVATYWNASYINPRLLGDKIFPMFVAAVGLLACLICLVRMMRAPEPQQRAVRGLHRQRHRADLRDGLAAEPRFSARAVAGVRQAALAVDLTGGPSP